MAIIGRASTFAPPIIVAAICFAVPLHFGHTVTFPPSNPRLGYQSGPDQRSTLNIVWTCLSTIFICCYSAMHPDIFDPDEPVPNPRQRRQFQSEKIPMVFYGLLAPELVLSRAVDEFICAVALTKMIRQNLCRLDAPEGSSGQSKTDVEIAPWKEADRSGEEQERSEKGLLLVPQYALARYTDIYCLDSTGQWNLSHSFFVRMNGFRDQSGRLLKSEHFIWLCSQSPSENDEIFSSLGKIQREINDKSKSDPLVKVWACIQVSWHLVSIVGRLCSGLPVSQMEWTTCSYIGCTLGIFFLWLKKPYGVSERISISVRDVPRDDIEEASLCSDNRSKSLFLPILRLSAD